MLHTVLITNRIISKSTYDEIYKNLDIISKNNGVNLYPVENGYTTNALKDKGFTRITLMKKKVDPKYNHPYMQLEIQLNPTKLLDKDIIELTTEEDLGKLKEYFDEEIQRIHSKLPPFYSWTLNRIDYAVNIKTPYVKEYVKLFQRADKPYSFMEQYDSVSKERKQKSGSLYLFNKSVAINFYDKESERISQDSYVESSKDILRLEVQCNKFKTNSMKYKYEFITKYIWYFLKKEISDKTIKHYYDKTVGEGDYYKLKDAIVIIQSSENSHNMQQKLIETLRLVNKSRSIWKARRDSNYSKEAFNRYLKKLRELNINPVTIPERWPVTYLPNILDIK